MKHTRRHRVSKSSRKHSRKHRGTRRRVTKHRGGADEPMRHASPFVVNMVRY